MNYVIPGGSGQVGQIIARALRKDGHRVIVLGRRATSDEDYLQWDARSLGTWAECMEQADVVINLAGRSVNCRYTEANLKAMMDSRVDSTRVVGEAIASATNPPALWLQMSTATIYAHRFDAPNDEATGILGGQEAGVPAYWARSIDIAKAWERTLHEAKTPATRKVALRTAMVMSPDKEGIFDVLLGLVRKRLGGSIGGGRQFVSWIHDIDFVRALQFITDHSEIEGAVNLAAPTPLPQAEFMKALREAADVGVGLPATKWMAAIGAVFMRSDTELLLKSRRVVPGRLTELGFAFEHSRWPEAAIDLVARSNAD